MIKDYFTPSSAIELEVRKLVDLVRDIRSQQQYLRVSTHREMRMNLIDLHQEREVNFREISEATNSSVIWWSALQTIVLVGAGVWQIYQLKTIFNAKKWDQESLNLVRPSVNGIFQNPTSCDKRVSVAACAWMIYIQFVGYQSDQHLAKVRRQKLQEFFKKMLANLLGWVSA